MKNIIVIKDFLSSNEILILNEWVTKAYSSGLFTAGVLQNSNLRSSNRFTTRFSSSKLNYPIESFLIKEKIKNILLIDFLEDSICGGGERGIVVNYIKSGGDIFPHKDQMEGDSHLLRCNILTQLPESGGDLLISGERIALNPGDLHCYLPSVYEHAVSQVFGAVPRIMWMFGFKIDNTTIEKLFSSHDRVNL